LLREITLLNQLQSSARFLPILAYVIDDEGRTRGFLLRRAGMRIDEVVPMRFCYLNDVLEGLCDICDISACHGDIFPRNILVNDGRAYLIDPGNQGIEYKGDREALIDTISILRDKAESVEDIEKMDRACSMLRGGLDFHTLLKSFN
jgi:tRNA A-37 threonylcarbamoyl transferase component Bud32